MLKNNKNPLAMLKGFLKLNVELKQKTRLYILRGYQKPKLCFFIILCNSAVIVASF
jgi:hypothetical protein